MKYKVRCEFLKQSFPYIVEYIFSKKSEADEYAKEVYEDRGVKPTVKEFSN